jgi:uncharacterized membrane protein
MTTIALYPAAAAYMTRLHRAARSLPKGARHELLEDIEAHLDEATSLEMSEAEVLSVLDRLGEPDEIVAAHLPVRVQSVTSTKGIQEWSAIILLLFGGFIFGVGWLLGLVLLWSSRAWTTVDKLVGTFVLPGGLSGVLFVLVIGTSAQECISGPGQRRLAAQAVPALLIGFWESRCLWSSSSPRLRQRCTLPAGPGGRSRRRTDRPRTLGRLADAGLEVKALYGG